MLWTVNAYKVVFISCACCTMCLGFVSLLAITFGKHLALVLKAKYKPFIQNFIYLIIKVMYSLKHLILLDVEQNKVMFIIFP